MMIILKNILLITLLTVIIFGTFFKDFYPIDEWRYVVITQDLSSSFLKLKYGGDDYFEKPPFYFWILYVFSKVCGMYNFFSFKLPNIILLLMYILIFRKYLIKFVSDYTLFLIIFFSIPINFVSVQLVRMDLLMNLFINMSILLVFNKMLENNLKSSVFFWSGFFSSLAVLIKGPAGFFVPFSVIFITVIMERKFKIFYFISFLLGFVILVLLWFLGGYIYFGGSYLESYLFKEIVGRIIYGKHHKENFFYYFLLFLPAILPFSLIFIFNLQSIFKSHSRFFLYWIVISLLVLSISRSKLIIYLSSIMLPVGVIISNIFQQQHLGKKISMLCKVTIILFILKLVLLLLAVWTIYLISDISSSRLHHLINHLKMWDVKIVVSVLIIVSILFIIKKTNPLNFLMWWIVTLSIISIFLYYKLNKHYDVSSIVKAINQECYSKNIYVYKWKTLYYFKWRGKNENIRFTWELPVGNSKCIITSFKIYREEKIGLSIYKRLSFSRDEGIVIIKK